MSIFNPVSNLIKSAIGNITEQFAPEITALEAAEAVIEPVISQIDPSVVGPAISVATGGKVTPAQAAAAITAVQSIISIIHGIIVKLQASK